jgi:hypothetical protein
VQIGLSEGELERMEREEMMQKWAHAVAEGRDTPVPVEVVHAEIKGQEAKFGYEYDPELERQRFEFEIRKWEAERARMEQREEAEQIRLEEERKLKE